MNSTTQSLSEEETIECELPSIEEPSHASIMDSPEVINGDSLPEDIHADLGAIETLDAKTAKVQLGRMQAPKQLSLTETSDQQNRGCSSEGSR